MSILRKAPIALAVALAMAMPASAVDFNDDQYHEIVLFHWDTAELEVLVVPPAAADAEARLRAVEGSIDAWASGIDQLGASWLADSLNITQHTLTFEVPPTSVVADPEILVVSGEVNPVVLFGIGASLDFLVCNDVDTLVSLLTAPSGLRFPADAPLPPEWHRHQGSSWAVTNAPCADNTRNVCVVVNTNFALRAQGQHWMYDLSAHEFGHCLGIGHVGDALDFEAKTYPKDDIMSYQHNPAQVHCVSNLNLRAIEGVFAKVLGRPASEQVAPFDYVHMDPDDYEQVPCSLPG